jgi:hypothetical protein
LKSLSLRSLVLEVPEESDFLWSVLFEKFLVFRLVSVGHLLGTSAALVCIVVLSLVVTIFSAPIMFRIAIFTGVLVSILLSLPLVLPGLSLFFFSLFNVGYVRVLVVYSMFPSADDRSLYQANPCFA